jgi:D-alanine-D-alanine ligase
MVSNNLDQVQKRITVALLSGGTSTEREVSLASGSQVYDALDKSRYDVRRYDPKTDLSRLVADAPQIDMALVMLHGVGGEDGSVQGLLDLLHIPYQCSGILGSSLAMHKLAAKHLYVQNSIPTPAFLYGRRGNPLMRRAASRVSVCPW